MNTKLVDRMKIIINTCFDIKRLLSSETVATNVVDCIEYAIHSLLIRKKDVIVNCLFPFLFYGILLILI